MSKLGDLYLKHHVKAIMKNYYLLMGMNMNELENKTLQELVQLVEKLLNQQLEKTIELQKTVEFQGQQINRLQGENEHLKKDKNGLQIRNEELFDRNERLTQRLSISMQHNTQELKQSKVVEIAR